MTIPWGLESGSRAWGFPSPDSDYDRRFLYARGLGDYLSPWLRRDVIETPLDKVFDVNGWDLAKALRLLVKGNGTLTEWLRSPIVYRGDPVFRDEFLALAEQVTDRALLGRRYRHVRLQHFATERLSLKRFFYALRLAAVLHWLDAHPDRAVPPMELMAALEDGDAPAEVRARIRRPGRAEGGDARVRRRRGAGCAGPVRGCRADPRGALRIRGAPRPREGAGAVRGVLRTGGGPRARSYGS